ncbi:MAG: hypothetical protein A4E60_02476 [Syntrophorhabdus sp. PtaB.Bin047]|jgi:hypothetical protein|nr:MAG: hypothetical protein A4E60_02476 [Syntrophorhabdus sp. PtaB.Bin047]
MMNVFRVLVILCLLMGFAGIVSAADGADKKPAGTEPAPTAVPGGSATVAGGGFDEATTQYLKKQRSINSELVAAHREVYKYNNPVKTPKGMSMADIVDQESSVREAREQEQTARNRKVDAEERIRKLEKDYQNLRQDLLKHYNGQLPKKVSDAWQTEEGYAAYLISKTK